MEELALNTTGLMMERALSTVSNYLTAQTEALVNWKSLVQHKCGVVSGLAKMYRESRAENATQAEALTRIRNIVDAQDSTEDTPTLVEREIEALGKELTAKDAEIAELGRGAWCPDVCPITGLEFFMWIERRAGGKMVPTYGGPFDSFTIPEKDEHGEYTREQYDHDEGRWTEYETVPVRVVRESEMLDAEATEARVKVLEEALTKIATKPDYTSPENMVRTAKAALRGEEG
jgi:hypothetical protein